LDGKGNQLMVIWSAIKSKLQLLNITINDPAKRIASIIEGAKRIYSNKNKRRNLEKPARQPFPVQALKFAISMNNNSFVHIRNITLVALGFRLMRRPNEIAAWNQSDIVVRDEGIDVFILESKTDKHSSGRFIPIEYIESQFCPASLTLKYLQLIPNDMRGKERPLFFSLSGKRNRISTSSISTIVKRMAKQAGFNTNVSGHSIRIGAASQAMKSGITFEQISSIGGWTSNAIVRYLRASSTSELSLSKKMGF